jgi:hypothetical protein
MISMEDNIYERFSGIVILKDKSMARDGKKISLVFLMIGFMERDILCRAAYSLCLACHYDCQSSAVIKQRKGKRYQVSTLSMV